MECRLCNTIHEEHTFIKETKHSFCVIALHPLKTGHVLVMPKRCVTQVEFAHLPAEEVKDLFELIEMMQNSLNQLSDEDVIVFKNSGKHSSQPHLHFHLLPSPSNLREYVSLQEHIPKVPEVAHDTYKEMQAQIKGCLQ